MLVHTTIKIRMCKHGILLPFFYSQSQFRTSSICLLAGTSEYANVVESYRDL